MTESAWFINIDFLKPIFDNVIQSPGNATITADLPDGQAALAGHAYQDMETFLK
jgi:hypothetical protein